MIDENDFLLISADIYRVVGDYTEVNTPNDYELVNIENEDDDLIISSVQLEKNLGNNWKLVDIDKL
jgi:hypothetical protein